MSAIIKGRAVVFSVGQLSFTLGIVGFDFPQSMRFNRTSEKAEVKDFGGIIRTQIFHGFRKTLSMTVVPCDAAASQSGANNSMDGHCVTPGTKVTIVDAAGTVVGGSYNVLSSVQNRTIDGVATLDLELEQGDEGVDLTLAVS